MKKQLFTILALSAGFIATAQVGINTTSPEATFDIQAKNATGTTTIAEGLIVPRVDRQRAASMTPVATSTMIYVNSIATGSATGTAVNIDAVGFYYYNGVAWVKLNAGGTDTSIYAGDGALAGNRIVSQNANTLAFTGTANNAFSVDGTTFSVDATKHYVGIGTTTPLSKLHLEGTLSGDDDDFTISSFYDSTFSSAQIDFRRSLGTKSVPTAVANTTPLGQIQNRGYDGSAYIVTALYGTEVNGTVATGSIPTDMYFSTGSTGITERMRISSTGNIGIATKTPTATLDITAKAATGTTTTVDGILIPRVTRQRAQSMTGVSTSTLVYINNIATGTATGTTANVDAIGFYYYDGAVWQKLGAGSTPLYQNITGSVNTLPAATTAYTISNADYTVITTAPGGVTLTFPTGAAATAAGFTAANAGKTIYIYNYNSNSTTGVANTPVGLTTSTVGFNGGRGFVAIWTGSMWITPSR